MRAANEATTAGAKPIQKAKRDPHLSKDGQWRSFPKVPNLLQYVIAGTYYARCKVDGMPVRASLETDVFTVAKQWLPDKLEELRKPKVVAPSPTGGLNSSIRPIATTCWLNYPKPIGSGASKVC